MSVAQTPESSVPAPAVVPPGSAETGSGTDVFARRTLIGGLVGGALVAALAGAALIAERPVPGIPTPGPVVEYGLPVVRVLLDLAAVAVIGLSLLPKLLGFDDPERTEPVLRRVRPAAVSAAWAWAVFAFVTVVFHTAELNPGAFPTPAAVASYVSNVGAGQGLVISGATALACAAVGLLAVRFGESVPAELRTGIALFGLLPIPVTGHAVNSVWHDPIMISMELHVMGATAWTGGLLATALFVAARRDLLAVALPKFSKLATVCLILVSVSGLISGLSTMALTPGVELPGALLGSEYGLLLVAKVVLACALVPLAAHIRFRLLPAIARRQATSMVAWAAAEVTVMGLAYGVAITLTRASLT
ncbi:copper resistance protein CopD [Microtetraspora sp. NBRC 13810]|uniref:copper resistance D family protein n=1 Tax=Microtetraspora sp. NBRC 13810 TaxID=3030990 RepID=UPI0024A4DEEC|nr:CopD family protein [Microtetraspora sp. NBRC 13810]GLW07796.1 copper resistance protein CopD [Microtetraspora sp. NBRC 13810]